MERGGAESVEIVMWLAMRGALGEKVRREHLTGYGLAAPTKLVLITNFPFRFNTRAPLVLVHPTKR
jgi:hypothetical protein